jgi:hypothetical protein
MAFTFINSNRLSSAGALELDIAGVTSSASLLALIDRKPNTQLSWNGGAGTDYLRGNPGGANVSAIFLQNHNFTKFYIQVNSVTVLDNTAGQTDTNTFCAIATTAATNVVIYVQSSATANLRKIGQFFCGDIQFALPRNPAFADYKPALSGLRIDKTMADGGLVTYKIAETFNAGITLNWMPETAKQQLYSWWQSNAKFEFAPFPTTTAWDGSAWEVNWQGDFKFLQPAANNRSLPYYQGEFAISETPK